MSDDKALPIPSGHQSPFEAIRQVKRAWVEYWLCRQIASVLSYADYRHFDQVVQKARRACFNGAERVKDHFVDVNEMLEIDGDSRRADKVTSPSWLLASVRPRWGRRRMRPDPKRRSDE